MTERIINQGQAIHHWGAFVDAMGCRDEEAVMFAMMWVAEATLGDPDDPAVPSRPGTRCWMSSGSWAIGTRLRLSG